MYLIYKVFEGTTFITNLKEGASIFLYVSASKLCKESKFCINDLKFAPRVFSILS